MLAVQPSSLPASLAPRLDRALADRLVRVGDDQVGVDLQAGAQAVAVDAHAERAVERERLRRQLGEADAAVAGRRAPRCRRARASSPSTATQQLTRRRPCSAVSTESVRRARSPGSMLTRSIDDLDGVLLLLVERGDVLQPLDERRRCARGRSRPCARPRRRSRNSPLRLLGLAAPAASTLVFAGSVSSSSTISARRAGGHLAAAQVAALLAGPGVEHAQVVVDLGDGADRRARVRRGRLLLDGDGRRQPADAARTWASPSGPGTAARRTTATRRSGAAPRRRACRRPATTCPSRRRR